MPCILAVDLSKDSPKTNIVHVTFCDLEKKKTPETKQKSKQIIYLLQVFRVIDLIVNIWHHLQGSAQWWNSLPVIG